MQLPKSIGVIHFPPLPGSDGACDMDLALQNALQDLHAFEDGGMEAVIIENNYDIPHRIHVLPETTEAFRFLGEKIRRETRMQIGVCVLWNDYKSALSVAKDIQAQFIRIPAFVDRVQTEYGIANPCSREATDYRSEIGAEEISILADVHVKHSVLLSSMTLEQSTEKAVDAGADGIIITGKWTGDPAAIPDLRNAKEHAGGKQIFAGSGVAPDNVRRILSQADGFIVSTALKEDGHGEHRQNIVGPERRISKEKVRALIDAMHIPS